MIDLYQFWGLGGAYCADVRKETETRIEAREAVSKAREAQTTASDIERRLDKLTLICMALWSLLSEKMQLTEENLMERVKTIDLTDGQADGKLQREVARCANCNRVMSRRHSKCIYCGADRLHPTAFDEVT
jgi:predicted Zn-ribbon and HTH transcriptional regulator